MDVRRYSAEEGRPRLALAELGADEQVFKLTCVSSSKQFIEASFNLVPAFRKSGTKLKGFTAVPDWQLAYQRRPLGDERKRDAIIPNARRTLPAELN
jgi:hypothetical protein